MLGESTENPCAPLPTNPHERAASSIALLRQALLKRAFVRLQSRMEQRLQDFDPDVVVGKPGGLTVAEVLACGRPLLVTQSLQGQESFSVQFLARRQVGAWREANHALDLASRLPTGVTTTLPEAG